MHPLKLIPLTLLLSLAAGTFKPGPADPFPPPTVGASIATTQSADQPLYSGCSCQYPGEINLKYEQQVIELTNQERAAQGLPPLKMTSQLAQAARYHAFDLGLDNYFAHDSYDRDSGQLSMVCAWSKRINNYYSGWGRLAENIAAGYGSPADVVEGWMNSPGHRANILDSGNRELGVGFYQGSGDYSLYWVQDFGRRSDVYPLIINDEVTSTDSPQAELYIYGSWDEIRLKNDAGAWSAWQSFDNTISWTLTHTAGERTVSAEMRSGDTTVSASDTILLTTTAAAPSVGNLPGQLAFIYSIPEQRFVVSSYELTPANTGDSQTLTWELSSSGSWFNVSTVQGTTPDSTTTIIPDSFDHLTPAAYSGALTFTVTSPSGVAGSPHTVELSLSVIDQPISLVFLPAIQNR